MAAKDVGNAIIPINPIILKESVEKYFSDRLKTTPTYLRLPFTELYGIMEGNRYYNVDAVVASVKNDLQETGSHTDLRLLQFAIEGFREMNFSTPTEIKTIRLKMNSYGAVNLPSDYITYTKVGVKYRNKVVIVGLAGEDLLVEHDAMVSQPSVYRMKDLGDAYDFQNYNHNTLRGYYAGDYAGSFTKCGNNQLQFHHNLHGLPVILEYLSDGVECGDTPVHAFWFEYLRQYVHWRRVSANDNAPQALKYEKEQAMKRARLVAAMRRYSEEFTPEYIVNMTKVAGNPLIINE